MPLFRVVQTWEVDAGSAIEAMHRLSELRIERDDVEGVEMVRMDITTLIAPGPRGVTVDAGSDVP